MGVVSSRLRYHACPAQSNFGPRGDGADPRSAALRGSRRSDLVGSDVLREGMRMLESGGSLAGIEVVDVVRAIEADAGRDAVETGVATHAVRDDVVRARAVEQAPAHATTPFNRNICLGLDGRSPRRDAGAFTVCCRAR